MLLAIVVVAGGYAFISNDNTSPVINNPVSNEISDANTNSSSSGVGEKVVKDIASDYVIQQANAIYSQELLAPIVSSDSSSQPESTFTASYYNVAASYGGNSYGEYALYYLSPGKLPYDNNINKEDYVLSPNYKEHIFIKVGQDFTDKYGMCVVDGFIPLGNITKPIENLWMCTLECGIHDAYFDLSNPYIYDTQDVKYYLKHGVFPNDVEKKRFEYENNQLEMNYRKLAGQNEVFLNVNDDFTNKYMLCMDCGRYFALGEITTPLDDIMICDYPNHFGGNVYIDGDNPSVVSPQQARDSWDTYLQDLYSNPDYHPIHFDQEGYGEEPQMDFLQQSPSEVVSIDNQNVVSSDEIV